MKSKATDGNAPDWLGTLYDKLAGDDEGRVCRGIPDGACREVEGNFFKTLLSNTLTSIGDRIASAKTTLPWLLAGAGAPSWCSSLLVPIRESGSMLPQLWFGGWVRSRPIRKTVWAAGSAGQGLCLMGIGWAGLTLKGAAAGVTVLALLVGFSLARAGCSLAYKDVLGKTVPKSRRGRLSGWITSVAGLAALSVGLVMGQLKGTEPDWTFPALLAGAALLWFGAAVVYQTLKEPPGETEGGVHGWKKAFDKMGLLRSDTDFRKFVVARALAMGSGLAAPYYVIVARRELGDSVSLLGTFIAAEGLAGLLSAPVWGRWADRSSRRVFAAACGTAAALSLAVAAWSRMDMGPTGARWFFPGLFFGLGIAHAGVRLGRKTYLVDMAEGNRRTDYVAVSNTVIGALLLLTGLVGAGASLISNEAALVLFGVMGLIGSALGLRLKEVGTGLP